MTCEPFLFLLCNSQYFSTDDPKGEVGDLKLSEIGPLLRDYRRLAGIIESYQKGHST